MEHFQSRSLTVLALGDRRAADERDRTCDSIDFDRRVSDLAIV